MLERDECDTERGDAEPVRAFVFMLNGPAAGGHDVYDSRAVVFVVKTLYAKLLR
jgi:hypothetical protein